MIFGIFFVLGLLALVAAPLLFITFIILWCLKKKKMWFGIAALACGISVFPLWICGIILDPTTWCEHEYTIVEQTTPTCTEQGKTVKVCTLCNSKTTEYIDMIDHTWVVDKTVNATCSQAGSVERTCSACGHKDAEQTAKLDHSWETDTVVSATCNNGGYIMERCSVCADTRKTDTEPALGHDMKEVSRTEPTYEIDGKVVTRCDRCGHEETVVTEKLTLETITFDGLELTFGQYSFTEVDNRFSEHYGKTVVKIPVTVKNISKEPHSLNLYHYQLFGPNGIESDILSYYFSDDVSQGGELLPDSSYTRYFHVIYDGDGVYTISFDNLLFDEKTVEITVKR